MKHVPEPYEWHPYYTGNTWLWNWLEEGDMRLARVNFPKFRSIKAMFRDPDETYPVTLAPDYITIERHECTGPAPYVGRPFAYRWWIGVDDFGRCVAGAQRIVYLGPDIHDPLTWL